MSQTRPTGEQLRFRSANTGEHSLDTYLEAAEIGGRQLNDLLNDLFEDGTGDFRSDIFEFRYNPVTSALQFRVGAFVDADASWQEITPLLEAAGLFSNATTYENLQLVTDSVDDVYLVHGLSAPQTFADETTFRASANTTKLINVSAARTEALAAAASATAAATSETNASTSASNAATSEANALAYRNTALTAETGAEAARDAAQTAQGAAETAQTAAETARAGAETAQAAVEAVFDSFDDRYLGAKTSDPTLDNDGNALLPGALYWNSTDENLRFWTGTIWQIYGAGTLAVQDANNVAITGGTIAGLASLTSVGDISIHSASSADMRLRPGADAQRSSVTFENAAGVEQFSILNIPNNNYLAFRYAGVDGFNLTSTGDVGMGTTSPLAKLHVQGASNGELLRLGSSVPDRSLTVTQYAIGGVNQTGYEFDARGTGGIAELSFKTASTLALTLDQNQKATFEGQVQVGNQAGSSSSVALAATGLSSYSAGLQVRNYDAGGWARLDLYHTSADDAAFLYHSSSGALYLRNDATTTAPFVLAAGATELARFTSGGALGLGVVSPTFGSGYNGLHISDSAPELHLTNVGNGVTGSDGFALRVNSAGVARIIQHENAQLEFHTNGAEKMRLEADGDLGLGTNSPQKKAEIGLIPNSINQDNALRLSTTGTIGTAAYRYADLALRSDGAGNFRWALAIKNDDLSGVEYEALSVGLNGSSLNFNTVGSLALSLDSSQNATFEGNVGIGTAPDQALHVHSSGNTYAKISTSWTGPNSNARFVFDSENDTGGLQGFTFQQGGASEGALTFQHSTVSADRYFEIFTGSGRLRTYSNGRVAINKTSAPATTLDVFGNGAFESSHAVLTLRAITTTNTSRLYFGNTHTSDLRGAIFYAHTDDSMALWTAGAVALTIGANKNVVFEGKTYAQIASAASPAYSFDGDDNTGAYSPGADQYGIATGGTLALTIDASQNATFEGTLDVGGGALGRTFGVTSTNESPMALSTTAATCNVRLINATSSTGASQPRFGSAGDALVFMPAGVTALTLDASQNAAFAGNITASGTIGGLDSAELTQLGNIGTTTISAAQWGYLGGADQALATTDNVTFADLTATGLLTAKKGSTLTISAGAITVTGSFHQVHCESGTTDTLDTISGGHDGAIIILMGNQVAEETITYSTAGNIKANHDTNLGSGDTHIFVYDSGQSEWRQIN